MASTTVLVTGGRGRSGRWIVDRLADQYRVVVVDLDHPGFDTQGRAGIEFRAADLTDGGEALDCVTAVDPDAVVHWAAIPAAGRHPGTRIFRTNTQAAYNTLTAAGRVGAEVVQASSDGTYGFFFAEETPLPEALPVPETHPLRPEDAYGLSKVVAEEIGRSVARADGVSVASIRPAWIQYPGEYPCRSPDYVTDPTAGAGNFWSYVDVRDVVDIVEAALAADLDGHEAFNCAAPDNALGEPLADLVEAHFGGLPAECTVEGDASPYATAKAERLLDWTPSYSWRTAADESVPEPALLA